MRPKDRSSFVRLANRRVPAAIKALELVSNLSNKSNYSFNDEDTKVILRALKSALVECEARFAGKEIKSDSFRLAE